MSRTHDYNVVLILHCYHCISMKILVIGSGGREHALAWRLAQSPSVQSVSAAPGNPGMEEIGTCIPADISSPESILAAAQASDADLTVIGPEAPLMDGVVDLFRSQGRAIVGPTAASARLEGSKIYAKNFFRRLGIPTADFVAVDTKEEAGKALSCFGFPVVLKVDGLAGGKGVIVARDAAEAANALNVLGGRLVIEEFLSGEEVSFIALSDGRNAVPLAPTQDHKAVNDGDLGPNTGGMGAHRDAKILTERQMQEIMNRIVGPAIEAARFTGFLYAGLMMTPQGPKVLEFNVRLGDPETQALMHGLKTDFAPVLMASAQGGLAGAKLDWHAGSSVCVVLASAGYPGAFSTGHPISGVEAAEAGGATVFHAGTRKADRGLETAGGRVLGVTASGADLPTAIESVYAAVEQIHFEGVHYRTDIGRKGLNRYNVGIRARSSDG